MNKIIIAERITHDMLIKNIFEEYKKTNKHKVVSLFLSSFSSNNLSWRSGLPVFAIMQSFPQHIFTVGEKATVNKSLFDKMSEEDKKYVISIIPCEYCSECKNIEVSITGKELIKEAFEDVGGLLSPDPLDYSYYLLETNKLETSEPTKEDFRIFSEILTILLEADAKDTVKKTIQSKIGKIEGFKSNVEQRKVLLETLGYCSILETDKHKGVLNQYINLGTAPSKRHSSYWNYPVDFWLGKDGINKEAFKFWFGEYPELEAFWK